MIHYRSFLSTLHRILKPKLYLEIGVRDGHSLALSRSKSYAIDPAFRVTEELQADIRLFKQTSDEFFAREDADALFSQPIDLAFIDGMHHFEFAYRDFLNIERRASRNGVVVFDDIFPATPEDAARRRTTPKWTGDVWKMIYALMELRPDLVLFTVDTAPTGLLVVCNLDPSSMALKANYDAALEKWLSPVYDVPPEEILHRLSAIDAMTFIKSGLLEELAAGKAAGAIPERVRERFPGMLIPGAHVVTRD